MADGYDAFKSSLLALKATTTKLITYSGNQTYKRTLEQQLISFDKHFKILKMQLEKGADHKILDLLVKMAAQVNIIHTCGVGQQRNRLEAIKSLELNCNDLEVYIEDGLHDANDIFSPSMQALLGKQFDVEFGDLRIVFNRSGTCTAFLLRKILEKAAYIALSKKGKGADIVDSEGNSKGLKILIDMCTKEKVNNHPILFPRTMKLIQGIKFLGDSAAHNPLIIVDMHEIVPQLPFISTGLKEIARSISEMR
jgi:hypothetical protein